MELVYNRDKIPDKGIYKPKQRYRQELTLDIILNSNARTTKHYPLWNFVHTTKTCDAIATLQDGLTLNTSAIPVH